MLVKLACFEGVPIVFALEQSKTRWPKRSCVFRGGGTYDLYTPEHFAGLDPAILDAFSLTAAGMEYREESEHEAHSAVACAEAGYAWRQAENGDLSEWRAELAPLVARTLADMPPKEIPSIEPRGRLIAHVAHAAFEAQMLLERGCPVPRSHGSSLLRAATAHVYHCCVNGIEDFPLSEQDVKFAFVIGMLIYDCAPLVPVTLA
jgi:hypothetical protein